MKNCVYTALFGGYEKLNEQSVAKNTDIPFICFTDDQELRSETWQIRYVTPMFSMDPVRSQREFKLQPHKYLHDYDYSIYIDNSVILKVTPEEIINKYQPNSGFHLLAHSYRQTILDEFLEVSRLGLDDQSRIFEQLNHYAVDYPEVLQERPYWGAFQIRCHHDPAVIRVLDVWYAHVLRYSRRDQLSLNTAFRIAHFSPDVIHENNHESWFHLGRNYTSRDRHKGPISPVTSLIPPVGRIRKQESDLIKITSELSHFKTRYEEANIKLQSIENTLSGWLGVPLKKCQAKLKSFFNER